MDIVFDGPPGPESGRFVEVESPPGTGINAGEWVRRDDGFWVLRLTLEAENERLRLALRDGVAALDVTRKALEWHSAMSVVEIVATIQVAREEAAKARAVLEGKP